MGEVEFQSLKGNVGVVARTFNRLLNILVIVGATITILALLAIRPLPTLVGLGFIILAALVIVSGLFGAMATGMRECFAIHLISLIISSAGLATTFLVIFLRFQPVVWALHPSTTNLYRAQMLTRVIGAIDFVLFTTQLIITTLTCMLNMCDLVEHSEDLTAVKMARQRAKMMGSKDRKSAISEPSHHKLTEKLREKYKQWTTKENERPVDLESLDPLDSPSALLNDY